MSDLETRVRAALYDLADEVRPAPLLARLEQHQRSAVRRHRLVVGAVAASLVAAVAAVAMLTLRLDPPDVEPVRQPPKIFRLSGLSSPAPGAADVAVLTAQVGEGVSTAHMRQARGREVFSLPPSEWVPSVYFQQLSSDGTRLVRQNNYSGDPRLEVVNLRTGSSRKLADHRGFCPQLSPDNQKLAIIDKATDRLLFVDVRTGRTLPGSDRVLDIEAPCRSIGFSPDGSLLAFGGPEATLLLDTRARTMARIENKQAVNTHMSWSPDGRRLLMYDSAADRYVVLDVDSRAVSLLRLPADAVRPMGWAGSRVVWLTGFIGDYRLVTTDPDGRDPQPWMRLDIGDRPVESVMWSSRLSGTPNPR